jgi:hypothetical protein
MWPASIETGQWRITIDDIAGSAPTKTYTVTVAEDSAAPSMRFNATGNSQLLAALSDF